MKDELRNPKGAAGDGGCASEVAGVVERWCFASGETPPQPAGEDACATRATGEGGLPKAINPEYKSLNVERAFPRTPAFSLRERGNIPPTHKKTSPPEAGSFQAQRRGEWSAVAKQCSTLNCFKGSIQA